MRYSDLVARTWNESILFTVMLELTFRCNLDCFYCYNDRGKGGRPLSLEEYRRLLDELHAMEVMNLVLSGGEPLVHRDFFAIGAAARRLGFVIRVKSNGHTLGGATARRLRDEVDPFVVDLSIHGADAGTHDRQTRVPGSFHRLLANLREMAALGLRLKLNCTVTRWNEDQLDGIVAIADDLAVPISMNPTVSPRDDGDRSPLDIAPTPAGLEKLSRLLARRAADARNDEPERPRATVEIERHCGAGASTLTIDPFGDVLPCVQWRVALGNVRERPIAEIWAGTPALDTVRDATSRAHELFDGDDDSPLIAHFCPGLAHALTGDPLAPYPAFDAQRRLDRRLTDDDTS